MKLIKNFTNVNTHVEDEVLKGIPLERLLVYAAGCEQRSLPNIDPLTFDPDAGRIDFVTPLGGAFCAVLIVD